LAIVEFWEKPGCSGNARQKATLVESGHTVIAHNLLGDAWTPGQLLPFLAAAPVAEWFNRNATRVKSGEVRPETYDAAGALAVLAADPLLIRRPLMRVGSQHMCGFDAARVAVWIGLRDFGVPIDESCQKHAGCGCTPPAAPGPNDSVSIISGHQSS
jgi:nitrogenase-associated protein